MRFQKRIKIIKGLNLNLSTSGISLTGGTKGASINVSTKGVFLNTSIPGTGLSDRRQLWKPGKDTIKESYNDDIIINIDDKGKAVILDSKGKEITDEKLLKKLKKTDYYKKTLEELIRGKKEEIEELSKIIEIYKFTPSVITKEDIEKKLKNSGFQEYTIKSFPAPRPSIEECRSELEKKAEQEITSIFFWTNDQKRREFVDNNLEKNYKENLTVWERDKNIFEEQEKEKKKNEDIKRKEEYELIKKDLEEKLKGEEHYINEKIENFLNNISIPIEFSIDYEYNSDKKLLMIDLDLPEIEKIPQKKSSVTSGGKLSIKDKTKKELIEDYNNCVCGLAFFFSGHFFNTSPVIEKVLISGYTQKLKPSTGNMENQYIYSVIFERDIFSKLNMDNIHPIKGFSNFTHRMNIDGKNEMQEIEVL
jgi:serine/threonine protein kinase